MKTSHTSFPVAKWLHKLQNEWKEDDRSQLELKNKNIKLLSSDENKPHN